MSTNDMSRVEVSMRAGVSLRIAALGLLAQHPGSGYDLLKRFEKSMANVWPATQSQLYGELNKLADAGLIEVSPTSARAAARSTGSPTPAAPNCCAGSPTRRTILRGAARPAAGVPARRVPPEQARELRHRGRRACRIRAETLGGTARLRRLGRRRRWPSTAAPRWSTGCRTRRWRPSGRDWLINAIDERARK